MAFSQTDLNLSIFPPFEVQPVTPDLAGGELGEDSSGLQRLEELGVTGVPRS